MRCLIIDDVHPVVFDYLAKASIEIDYQPTISAAEAQKIIPEYEGLILRSKLYVSEALVAKCPKLRFIGRAGAGLDAIDEEAVKAKGVRLFHAAQGNSVAVAEHTVGMLLSLLNHMQRADRQVRQGIWEREGNRGYELSALTVGIIGYGHMGRETAHRLHSFGCRLLSYDKYKRGYGDQVVEEVRSQTIKEHCDVISLHIPLTKENKFWFNKAFITSMQKPFWLINTSRGEIAKVEDIDWGLETGKIRGAALDVLENEKIQHLTSEQVPVYERMMARENVLLTPHVAGWTFESYEKISRVLGEKVSTWAETLTK